MLKYVLDTSYVIAYKAALDDSQCVLSEVVLLELIGKAQDTTTFKRLKLIRDTSLIDETLLTVEPIDWEGAGRILYCLEKQRTAKHKGKPPPFKPGVTQKMAFDALIAVSAKRLGVAVVTENVDDFLAIKYYLRDLKILPSSEYRRKRNLN